MLPDGNNFLRIQAYYLRQSILWMKYRVRRLVKRNDEKLIQLKKLYRTHVGQCCFVFANGPSLKLLDPRKIESFVHGEEFDVFVVNQFLESDRFAFAGHVSLVLSDPGYFPDVFLPFANTWSRKRVERLFIPGPYEELCRSHVSHIEIYPFCDAEDSWIFSRNISPLHPRSYLSMTAYKALAIAVFLGYDKIYICGFDNTYIRNFYVDKENRAYRIDEHFDLHAYPDGQNRDYWPTETFGKGAVAELLVQYARLFKDLHRFPADRIVNLDPYSLVDAFPKHHDLDVYDSVVGR